MLSEVERHFWEEKMDFAINVVVPAAQAFIMVSPGLGLTDSDFKRVFSGGRAVIVGVIGQNDGI